MEARNEKEALLSKISQLEEMVRVYVTHSVDSIEGTHYFQLLHGKVTSESDEFKKAVEMVLN